MKRSNRGRQSQPAIRSDQRASPPRTASEPLWELFEPLADLDPLPPSPSFPSPDDLPGLPDALDGRLWHPEGAQRPAPTLRGSPAILEGAGLPSLYSPRVFSNLPSPVRACVQRHQRREVLFALGHGGKGSRKPKRRSWRSNFRCP